jgi:hypothetical protein
MPDHKPLEIIHAETKLLNDALTALVKAHEDKTGLLVHTISVLRPDPLVPDNPRIQIFVTQDFPWQKREGEMTPFLRDFLKAKMCK